MKKRLFATVLALILAMAMAFTVVGCGNGEPEAPPAEEPAVEEPAPEEPEDEPADEPEDEPEDEPAEGGVITGEGLRVGYTTMDLANPYFIALADGMQQRADELGVELHIHDAQQDPAAHIAAIENWIAMEMDAIIISPFDTEALEDVTQRAHDAGIVLINGNQEYVGPWDAFVTIPEFEYGEMIGVQAGQWIRDELDGEAEVAILSQTAIGTIVDRVEGIIYGIHTYAPNAEIVAHEDALTPAEGLAATETILIAHPNVEVIVAFNDSGALGAYEAVVAAGRDSDRFFIGAVDAVPDAIERIKEGGIYRATVDIDPFGTGAVFLDTAIRVLNEGPIEEWVVIPKRKVNYGNVFEIFPD